MQTGLHLFSERLREVITRLGFRSPNEFARDLGYSSPEKINRLLRDATNKPSSDILYDIANRFAVVNMRWLITGEGSWNETGSIQFKKYTKQDPKMGPKMGPNQGPNSEIDQEPDMISPVQTSIKQRSNADQEDLNEGLMDQKTLTAILRVLVRLEGDVAKIQEDILKIQEHPGEA